MLDIDPDFALQSRLSFGRRGVYAWAAVAGALFVGFGGVSLNIGLAFGLAQAGAFLLLAALPYGAIQVRALERGGHMDARRLTGRPPVALGLALVGGSAWAFLAAGGVLLAGGAAAGHAFPAFTLAALIAMSVAMALIVLLLPPSATVDSWVLLVLLFMGTVGTVHIMGADRGVALGVLIVSAIICPWALPIAVRRMQGAPQQAARRPRSLVGRFVDLHRTSRPEFAKALLSAGTSLDVAAAITIAGALAIVWLTRQYPRDTRDIFEILIVYGPLVLAGYDAAARVHHERVTGALDSVCLSGQTAWRVVIESAFAFSLPFVAVSIGCAVVLAAVDPQNAAGILAHWPVTAGILIFWPLTGAFRGRQPGFYVAGAIALAFSLGRSFSHLWVPGVLALAAAVVLATANLKRTGRDMVNTRTAVAGSAILAAIIASLWDPEMGGLVVAGLLSLAVGLFIPDGARVPSRTILAAAAAGAVAAGVVEYFWVGGHLPIHVIERTWRSGTVIMPVFREGRGLYAAVVALQAAAGLAFGCWTWNRFRDRRPAGFAVRAIPLVAAVVLLTSLVTHADLGNDAFMRRYHYNGLAVLEILTLALVGGAAAAMGWWDWASTRRERTRPS